MRCPSCGTRDLPVTAGAYRCCGIVTRPLFLPASAACYAAWWEAMDERLMVAKSAGIRARRLARAAVAREPEPVTDWIRVRRVAA